MRLRFLSYLAPSLPEEIFRVVTHAVGRALSVETTLAFETRFSGPMPGEADPLAEDTADVLFVCAPTYAWLAAGASPPVLLAAPVPLDARANRQPVYFADVVVRRDEPARTFDALVGKRWAYNDPASLSGYLCLERALAQSGLSRATLGEALASGSHLASLSMVERGLVDAAPIDSNVLARVLRESPALDARLRVAFSWGPFPIQPVIARRSLPHGLQNALRRALLDIGADVLAPWGFSGFSAVDVNDYFEPEQPARSSARPRCSPR